MAALPRLISVTAEKIKRHGVQYGNIRVCLGTRKSQQHLHAPDIDHQTHVLVILMQEESERIAQGFGNLVILMFTPSTYYMKIFFETLLDILFSMLPTDLCPS